MINCSGDITGRWYHECPENQPRRHWFPLFANLCYSPFSWQKTRGKSAFDGRKEIKSQRPEMKEEGINKLWLHGRGSHACLESNRWIIHWLQSAEKERVRNKLLQREPWHPLQRWWMWSKLLGAESQNGKDLDRGIQRSKSPTHKRCMAEVMNVIKIAGRWITKWKDLERGV